MDLRSHDGRPSAPLAESPTLHATVAAAAGIALGLALWTRTSSPLAWCVPALGIVHAALVHRMWTLRRRALRIAVELSTSEEHRRLAETAFEESRRQLRSAADAGGIGLWSLAGADGTSHWDGRAASILGLPEETGSGGRARLFDLVRPADRAELEADLDAILRGGGHMERRVRVDAPSGEPRHVHFRGRCESEAPPGERRVEGTVQDVTERFRLQRELERVADRLDRALQGTTDGFWDWDPDRNDYWLSSRYLAILGWSEDEFPWDRDWFHEWLHPEDRHRFDLAVRQAIECDEPLEIEYRMRTRRGVWRWLRLCGRVARAEDGTPLRLSGSVRDVTTRKTVELALQESEQRFRAAIVHLPIPVMIHADDGTALAVNREWSRLWGDEDATVEEWIARYRCDDAAAVARPDGSAERMEGPRQVLTRDGEARIVELRPVHAIDDPGSGPSTRLLVAVDLTEHERARAAERERQSLAGAVDAMERLVAVTGHELRTPLGAMRATCELLLATDDGIDDESRRFLRSMHGEVVRLAHIVSNLLEAARLDGGGVRWDWGPVHLADVMAETVQAMTPLVDREKVRLEWDAAPPDLGLQGDALAIHRILVNLIGNAAKHTREGSIRLRGTSERNEDGAWVRIEVEDTGDGVAADAEGALGRPIEGHSWPTGLACSSGTGLGLSVCRHLAAAHGGGITFTSHPGAGSTFTVRIRADLPGPSTESPRPILRAETVG